jgi:sterol desaturase/sphingolipid hydroxylase (fatty acid hydroxylase superfamily)
MFYVLTEVWGAVWPRWLVAGIAFVLIYALFRGFFRRHKIQDRRWDWKQFGHEILFSILTLGAGNLIGLAVWFLVDRGYARILDTPMSWSTLGTIAWQFAVYFVLFDVYFYFLHRLMHTRALYWMHKVHHRSTAPNPLSAFSFHPLEGLLTGGFVPLMVFFFDLHVYAIIAVNLYGVISSVLVHSGHEIFPRGWYRKAASRYYISPMYHDRHHSTYRFNFGAFTTVWDRLFGTMHPAFEADYGKFHDRIVERSRPLVEAPRPAPIP